VQAEKELEKAEQMAQEWPWHWLALAEPPDPYSLALLFVGNQPAAKFTGFQILRT